MLSLQKKIIHFENQFIFLFYVTIITIPLLEIHKLEKIYLFLELI